MVEDKLTYRGRNNDGDEGLVVVVGTGNRRGEGDLETPSPQGDTATQIQQEASQKKPRTEARRTRSGNDRKTGGGSKGLARLVRWGTRIRGGEDRMRHNAQYYLGMFGTALLHIFQLCSTFFSQTVSAPRTQFEEQEWSCEST